MYIPVSNPQRAKQLTESLYSLSRPNPNPDDVTTSLFSWVTHPDGRVMADIPDGISLPIAVSSNPKILASLLQPFVLAKAITANDVLQIETTLTNSKGGSVLLTDILPAFWLNQQKTFEELTELGWFVQEFNPSLKN